MQNGRCSVELTEKSTLILEICDVLKSVMQKKARPGPRFFKI